MKSFNQWKYEEVETTFKLERVKHFAPLKKWLAAKHEPSEANAVFLQMLQNLLIDNVNNWNEEELKFHFLGPLMLTINFITDQYQSFLERTLSATIDGMEVSGRFDFLVAQGKQTPKAPFFCVHEYKPEPNPSGDPLGQLLIEMLTVQHLNQTQQPIYGAYVVGRLWFFVILEANKYDVSLAYDATKDDLYGIYSILKEVKVYIEGMLK